jgi:hypothetical protein
MGLGGDWKMTSCAYERDRTVQISSADLAVNSERDRIDHFLAFFSDAGIQGAGALEALITWLEPNRKGGARTCKARSSSTLI